MLVSVYMHMVCLTLKSSKVHVILTCILRGSNNQPYGDATASPPQLNHLLHRHPTHLTPPGPSCHDSQTLT